MAIKEKYRFPKLSLTNIIMLGIGIDNTVNMPLVREVVAEVEAE